ncbi:MAG: hypothetical protein ABIQ95_08420 [Bdellovibrionia bacterium]
MRKILSPQEWAQEFEEFTVSNEVQPPAHLSTQILSQIQRDLKPSPWQVFFKLVGIHGLVGTITLLFCPQFGFSPLSDVGLMNIFMPFGKYGCMLGCGAVYVGSSAFVASFLLKPEEIKVLRRTEGLQVPFLGLLSVAVFICFGATIVFELTVMWFLGTILGGLATLELGWLVRRTFVAADR